MGCSSGNILKAIDKDVMSISVANLKKAVAELPDDYIVAFKTADCLMTSVVQKYGSR